MEWIIIAIISGSLLVGSFFGGFVTGQNAKPTTQITEINTTQQMTVDSTTKIENYQAQLTIVDTRTNFNINLSSITNLIKSSITNTNFFTSQTNHK